MRSLFGNLHPPSGFSPFSGQAPGRPARGHGVGWFLLCVLAGALQAASLAWPLTAWVPPGLAAGQPSGGLQIVSLALLVLALRHAWRVRQAVWRAWVFATAWLAGTFWWLFISMHTYGGLPAPLAALAVLALAGLLALYYAVAAGVLCCWAPYGRWRQGLLFAALWTLAELLRGTWFTGFPWGAGGYAQVEALGVWAPWVGVYGMGFLSAGLAYALAVPFSARTAAVASGAGRSGGFSLKAAAAFGGLVVLAMAPRMLGTGAQNTESTGALRAWLLQGNIAQDEKFEAGTGIAQALTWYPAQFAEAQRVAPAQRPQLVVAPETALPLLPAQLEPAFWEALLTSPDAATGPQPGWLAGLPLGSLDAGYTNSVWGIAPDRAERARRLLADTGRSDLLQAQPPAVGFYRYDKHHLVPFGEFIPPLFRWFTDLMNIPLGDFGRGALPQAPWGWAGQRLAPNICYEDLFGEELAAAFQDPATAPTVLVNVSNIGWFGDSVAIDQHLQISRLRAMELGRPMLRATNTGATAAIDHTGRVVAQLPRLTRDRLDVTVEGRSGLTLYARWASRWGLWPLWIGCLGLALAALLWPTRARRPRAGA